MITESIYIKNQLLAEAIVTFKRKSSITPSIEHRRDLHNARNAKLKLENDLHKANLLAKRVSENKFKWRNFYLLISQPQFIDWYYSMTGEVFVVDEAMADVLSAKFNIDYLINAYNKKLEKQALDDLFATNGYSALSSKNRRRIFMALATPAWANMKMIKSVYLERDQLNMQTDERYEVDHIIPIQGVTVCGLHVENNLRVITAFANRKKKNLLTCELI